MSFLFYYYCTQTKTLSSVSYIKKRVPYKNILRSAWKEKFVMKIILPFEVHRPLHGHLRSCLRVFSHTPESGYKSPQRGIERGARRGHGEIWGP